MGMSPKNMGDAIVRNLPKKTGRSLEAWKTIVTNHGPKDRKEQIKWLKESHGLGSIQAQIVVDKLNRPADYVPKTDNDLIDAQYSGKKEALRPVFDKIIALVDRFGGGVEVSARKTIVSLIYETQFAVIRPTTNTRIDILLKMPDVEYTRRLVLPSKADQDNFSHLVSVTGLEDVDYEVYNWMKSAYERKKYVMFK